MCLWGRDKDGQTAEALKRQKRILDTYTESLVSTGKFTKDDLLPEYKRMVEKVAERGIGVCSRCQWRSGCSQCDETKALRYYLRKQLSQSPKATVGRPKKKA